MSTPDRTTIKAALTSLVEQLRGGLAANPPTAAAPFRSVVEGPAKLVGHDRPFLAVEALRTRLLGTTADDKVVEVELRLRVVGDASGSAPHAKLFDLASAVDDFLDALRDGGFASGVAGLDDREWTFAAPEVTAGVRAASADARGTMVVRVEREHNREPA